MLDRDHACVKWSPDLLLRHAMERAQPQHQIDCVDADHLAIREQLCQSIQCNTVILIVERRHKHQIVRNVEICVAGRQPLTGEDTPAPASEAARRATSSRPDLSCLSEASDSPAAARNWHLTCPARPQQPPSMDLTKRARSSTCPCVSSPAIPRFSQSTRVNPEIMRERPIRSLRV